MNAVDPFFAFHTDAECGGLDCPGEFEPHRSDLPCTCACHTNPLPEGVRDGLRAQ